MEDLIEMSLQFKYKYSAIQESTEFDSMAKYPYNLTRNTQQYQSQLTENLKIRLYSVCPVFMVLEHSF